MAELHLIGRNARRLRKGLGFTQEELGRKAHADGRQVRRVEAGENFKVDFLLRLTEALKVDVNELLRAAKENSSAP